MLREHEKNFRRKVKPNQLNAIAKAISLFPRLCGSVVSYCERKQVRALLCDNPHALRVSDPSNFVRGTSEMEVEVDGERER